MCFHGNFSHTYLSFNNLRGELSIVSWCLTFQVYMQPANVPAKPSYNFHLIFAPSWLEEENWRDVVPSLSDFSFLNVNVCLLSVVRYYIIKTLTTKIKNGITLCFFWCLEEQHMQRWAITWSATLDGGMCRLRSYSLQRIFNVLYKMKKNVRNCIF